MRLFLFSIFFVSLSAFGMFKSDDCIQNDFSASVKREGAVFGAFDYKFEVKKHRCLVELKYSNVMKSNWTVDICREPIHIKVYQYFSEKVYMKQGRCVPKDKSTFCKKSKELISLIEKEGLVHAEGERDTLDTNHGRVYCIYSILRKHLNNDAIFSMNNEANPALFEDEVIVKEKTIEIEKPNIVDPPAVETKKETKEVSVEVPSKTEEELDKF